MNSLPLPPRLETPRGAASPPKPKLLLTRTGDEGASIDLPKVATSGAGGQAANLDATALEISCVGEKVVFTGTWMWCATSRTMSSRLFAAAPSPGFRAKRRRAYETGDRSAPHAGALASHTPS